MKPIRRVLSVATAATALVLSFAAAAQTAMTEAQVRRVDAQTRKITLTHGEIKNLDMPPMTMVFDVKSGVPMDKIKAGDKVRFAAIQEAGKLTVTAIRPAE